MNDKEFSVFMRQIGWTDDMTPPNPSPLYDLFTDRARKVMRMAERESDSLSAEYVGTEHILLGLIREKHGVAGNVLRNLGIGDTEICDEIIKNVTPGDSEVSGLRPLVPKPLSPRAKQTIEFAMEEAKKLDHNYVGTEHLLLGLLRAKESIACQVINNLVPFALEGIREAVLDLIIPKPDVLTEIKRIVNSMLSPANMVEQIKKLLE